MTSEICVPNIGRRQRGLRLAIGVASAAAGLLVGLWLMGAAVARPWRLMLALPFFGAAAGVLQYREHT